MTTIAIRQGDVPMIRLDKEPQFKGSRKDRNTKLVRKGEHGGVHQLADLNKATIVDDVDLAGNLFGTYVHVIEPTTLDHTTSHKPLPLETGWYQVLEQREWIGSRSRRVMD